jgi:hypothetical protein
VKYFNILFIYYYYYYYYYYIGTSATTLVGVSVSSTGDAALGAASKNGVGAQIEMYDGSTWTHSEVGAIEAGLLMACANGPGNKVQVATSMLGISLTTDGGETYTTAAGVGGLSQSAVMFNDGQNIGLTGTFFTAGSFVGTSGVATSADNGASWDVFDVAPSVRYGAFPSTNTWYVSSGMWDTSDSVSKKQHILESDFTFSLSSRLRLDNKKSNVKLHKKSLKSNDTDDSTDNTNLWWGAISKTTDGGKTFTEIYRTNSDTDFYYFNEISCYDENHCSVVGEGQQGSADGPNMVIVLTTSDGGVTWKESFTSTELLSLMTVHLTSATEGWFAGVSKSIGSLNAQFYFTTDGGMTWSLKQSLGNCFPMSLDYSNNLGACSCCSSSGASSQMALYV